MPRLRARQLPVVLAAFAAVAYILGGPVAWGVFTALAAATLLDFSWAWGVRRRLECACRVPGARFMAGEPLRIELRLRNGGWLPAPQVTVRDAPGSQLALWPHGTPEQALAPLETAVPLLARLVTRRGRYRLGPFLVSATGPFGFWEARLSVTSDRAITVLPRLVELPGWPTLGEDPFPDPSLVTGIRPLMPGDPPRRLHWKHTARTGRAMVKELEPPRGDTCLIVLDRGRSAYADADHLDAAVEVAAAVGAVLIRQGRAVALSGHAPTRNLALVLEQLAVVAATDSRGTGEQVAVAAADFPRAGTLVLVSPAPPEQWGLHALPRTAAVWVLQGEADRHLPDLTCARLAREGLPVWAVAGPEELARRLRLAR